MKHGVVGKQNHAVTAGVRHIHATFCTKRSFHWAPYRIFEKLARL